MPKSFAISYDSYNWNGVSNWVHYFYQIDTNLWKETITMNGDLKLIQYVGTDVATRYRNWGYTKTKKTGMDYRNIVLTVKEY